MSATLSTHVLDTMHGVPAAGISVTLTGPDGISASVTTNGDGRAPDLLAGIPALPAGAYRLSFGVADYFRARGVTLPDPPFLDLVSIEFGLGSSGHYHVPLLVSPFSYSTYRGS
ncbi:hydroxyisourate hydrolase [Novosphingobium umbonatum]|uniref:5-hydroxyisourate hydrolase n=1 Tax=Novosphingobium umbonatum TaxID=1908524 RepID=A0A3S2UW03_9SPHN|nr:hydroxyisourate hydrolase [Novosphingobium umbonatum]RVU07745.1 hydroxyisourate hydrolase [Novosphingobium umbonatum]